MLKKGLVKFTGLVMIAAMLTGCGSSSTSKNNNSATTAPTQGTTQGTTATTAPDTGSTEEPAEITVMVWDRGNAAPGTTNEENTLTKWIQEQVLATKNVKVNYMAVPRSGSDDKINVMMAGGTAPDIIFTYDQSIYGNYASSGGLADLTEAYANNGQTIQQNIGDIQYMGQLDGKQYAIMKRRGVQVPRHVSYIRKDWLDALGMSVPTTKEELFTALRAFKEKNPGNVDNVIPWAMGGTTDTEKFYLNFIGSYVPEMSEEDAYVYSENFKVFADGAIDGLKQMNQLYNEGLITPDFATDTSTDIYKQDVSAGKVGFVLDDTTAPWSLIETLKASDPNAEFVPVNCFDTPEGDYINPTEPLFGMFIMIPATSQDKVDACMKYLDWMADPTVSENIVYTPEHTYNEANVPVGFTEEELFAKGYPGTCADLSIVNDHFTFTEVKESVVSNYMGVSTWEDVDWYNNFYDVIKTNQFTYPTYPVILDSEATYSANVKDLAIEYVYRLISCDPSKFDTLQQSEYKNLVNAGLEKIFEERRTYYKENVAK